MAMEFRPHREQLLGEAVSHMLGVVLFLFIITAGAQHHNCGPSHDHCEDDFDPRTESQQAGTNGNEDAAEHNGADNAPIQDSVTHAIWHFEPCENRHEHEQVVDAQNFFKGVASYKQAGDFRAVLYV